MISAIYLDPWYWGGVLLLTVLSAVLTKSRPLGFRFLCLVLLSQYVVHSLIAFGPTSTVALFCALMWIVFVVLSLPVMATLSRRLPGPRLMQEGFTRRFDRTWFTVARLFLLGYWTARLAIYPYAVGGLDLAGRLAAQENDRVLFFLAQVTLPALAACMAVWLRRGRSLTVLDLAVLAVVVVGLIGSDSKATLLPIVLTFFGALEMIGRRLKEFGRFAIPSLLLGLLAAGRLLLFFPGASIVAVGDTMLYRIAANTDSLEYLAVDKVPPGAFPFAGLPALLPYISKLLGYRYDYSPGVWLYGERFGDFRGFGPNSGPVLDYFGNIGWWGLVPIALLALVLTAVRGRGTPLAVSTASVVYLGFVDVTLLNLPVLFWGAVALLVAVGVASSLRWPVMGHALERIERVPVIQFLNAPVRRAREVRGARRRRHATRSWIRGRSRRGTHRADGRAAAKGRLERGVV